MGYRETLHRNCEDGNSPHGEMWNLDVNRYTELNRLPFVVSTVFVSEFFVYTLPRTSGVTTLVRN